MLHEMQLQTQYFNKIKSGQKCYEIRIFDEKRKLLTVGDRIVFSDRENPNRKIETIVEKLVLFETFDHLLTTIPLREIGFENQSVQTVKDIYRAIYPTEKEKLYGVVAIKIILV